METVIIKYNRKNDIVRDLLAMIIKQKGVEVESEIVLTEAEIKAIEKSKNSGIVSADKLKKTINNRLKCL